VRETLIPHVMSAIGQPDERVLVTSPQPRNPGRCARESVGSGPGSTQPAVRTGAAARTESADIARIGGGTPSQTSTARGATAAGASTRRASRGSSRPPALFGAITGRDPAAAKRAFEAMMTMNKIDIATIETTRRR